MKIKRYRKFVESISGTELIGAHMGPGYPDQKLAVTLSQNDTNVIFSDITSQFYTKDDYDDLYGEYIKKGGKSIDNSFTKENLEKLLEFENS